MEDLDLAALLSTRICHDLVGPVGALGNGVELLAEEDGADLREQALDLLGMSAEQASRRLRFFRLACGTMKWGDEPMDEGEARAAAAGMLEAGRTTLDWPAGGVAGLTQGRARALLNLVLVAAECLPSGGEVRVGPGAGGGTELAATGWTRPSPTPSFGAFRPANSKAGPRPPASPSASWRSSAPGSTSTRRKAKSPLPSAGLEPGLGSVTIEHRRHPMFICF